MTKKKKKKLINMNKAKAEGDDAFARMFTRESNIHCINKNKYIISETLPYGRYMTYIIYYKK